MHDLLRSWQKVEALPVAAGIDAQWRELLGDDVRAIEPYLRPEQQLATTYPCPHPIHDGCPRRVVHHGPDDIVAVCGNASRWCEPVKLTRRDLVVRSLKTKEWMAAITEELRAANGLQPLDLEVEGAVAVGVLARRGRRVAVVWLRREVDNLETVANGIRARLDGLDLALLLPPDLRRAPDRLLADGRIVFLAPPTTGNGDLALWRALDLLDPRYRERRPTDPTAIFDEVMLELATVPGQRHLVRINGHEFGGFQKSDQKFLRLLTLAVARAFDDDVEDGGWIKMVKLQVADEKNKGLEKLRIELRNHDHPDLTEAERAALVKTSPNGDSTVRLALDPHRIVFDASLADFRFIGEQQTKTKSGERRRTPGADELEKNLRHSRAVSKKLVDGIRKLGLTQLPAAPRG